MDSLSAGDSLHTLVTTCDGYLRPILDFASPLVAAAALAIGAWAASRIRSTSSDVRSISSEVGRNSSQLRRLHEDNGSDPDAPDQRKS
jgi:hypothetical protein